MAGTQSNDGPAGSSSGGADGGGPDRDTTSAGSGAAGEDGLVELPAGSREIDGIVNIIDAAAAAEIDDFLSLGTGALSESLNLFLTYYEERYDFVFLFNDHGLPAGASGGRFMTVTAQPRLGTGATSQYLVVGLRTNGRVKGTMAVQYGYGPFSHEIGHYWGVFLDASFGFGVGKSYKSSVHWGYAGVNGTLGGFDPKTLQCLTPVGASPADCTPLDGGRYRYLVKSFSPSGNGIPYAALELYLMGLAGVDEVPAEFPVLQEAEEVANSFDAATGTQVVEAAGIKTVTAADIRARHGTVIELAESERHFTSAFVVVSATPATDEVLKEVALRAAAFGDRGTHSLTKSFFSDTGGRATMNTVLGPRRSTVDVVPAPRPPFKCDPIQQDCDDGLGCYGSFCAIPGSLPVNGACDLTADCVAGSRCITLGSPAVGQCAQYCDSQNPNSPLACDTLCTAKITIVDDNKMPVETLCRPQPLP